MDDVTPFQGVDIPVSYDVEIMFNWYGLKVYNESV